MFEDMNMDLKTVWDSTRLGLLIPIGMCCIVKRHQGIDLLLNLGLCFYFVLHEQILLKTSSGIQHIF